MFSVLISIILSTALCSLKGHVVSDAEGNQYKLVMKIGEGGNSDTYLAQQLVNNQLQPGTKAIKILDYGETEYNRELLRNYSTAQSITARYPEYFLPFQIGDLSARNSPSDGVIIMPTLKSSLDTEISNLRSVESRVALATETLMLFINTADILMRNGYIHGDIIPGNIGRTADNRLVLIDFDSFTRIGERGLVDISLSSAPEFLKNGRANLVTDVYSMGITLGQALFFSAFNHTHSAEQIAEYFKASRQSVVDVESRRHLHALELFVSASLQHNPKYRQQKLLEAIQQIRSEKLLSAEYNSLLENFEKTLSEKSQRVGFFRSIGHMCSDVFNF